MATSGTDTYNLTRDQIIRAAFETIGIAVANEPLEAEDIAVGAVALHAITLAWKSYGLQLWKRGRVSLTLVASDADYSLTTATGSYKPMRILECNREDSNGNQVSVTRLSLQEYDALPSPTTEGTPINFYFEPARTDSTLYVWPVPDTTAASEYTLEIVYQQSIEDMDVGNEDVDFPNEWYRALILNLAYDLAPKYGIGNKEREILRVDAGLALQLALSYDQEDTSIFIHPRYKGIS